MLDGRAAVEAILDRRDPRRIVVVGPCSIHDLEAARDYARRLHALAQDVKDTQLVVMRVYFEKPRTSTGWKGLINDPRMDDSFHIEEGVIKARELLLDDIDIGQLVHGGTACQRKIRVNGAAHCIGWTRSAA